jgi:hypothetical protein
VAATLQELVDVQHNEVNDRFPNAMLLSLPKPTELDRVSEAQLQTLAGDGSCSRQRMAVPARRTRDERQMTGVAAHPRGPISGRAGPVARCV